MPAAAPNPTRRQRQCIAWGDAGITAGGDGRAQILFPAKGLKRQPLLRIPVPNAQVSAGLPQPALCLQGRGLRMGSCICGLVQPPAPPQRHQVRDATSAPQGSSQGNLPAASRGLRGRTPCQSNSLEPEHPLLAPTRRSVDQQATGRERTGPGVNVNAGRLSGSPGVTSFLKVTGAD